MFSITAAQMTRGPKNELKVCINTAKCLQYQVTGELFRDRHADCK